MNLASLQEAVSFGGCKWAVVEASQQFTPRFTDAIDAAGNAIGRAYQRPDVRLTLELMLIGDLTIEAAADPAFKPKRKFNWNEG